MKKFIYLFILIFSLINTYSFANENIMILNLKYGKVELELFQDKAPLHVKRFKELADQGKYDNVVFHRVIDGFMAQTGDVKFGNSSSPDFNLSLAGTGGSDLPDVKAEFSDIAHDRGVLSAARSADPDSANSQFFICLESAPHLDRQYSAFGKVISGMEFVDKIKKGDPSSGSVPDPDRWTYAIFHSKGGKQNRSAYSNKIVDEALDTGRNTADQAIREKAYVKAMRQALATDYVHIPLIFKNITVVHTNKVKNFKPSPQGDIYLYTPENNVDIQ